MVWILVLSFIFTGCQPQDVSLRETPELLTIGVLPFQEPERLRDTLQPLLDYLSETLEVEIQLTIASDYEQLIEEFGTKSIDIASFGGVGFVEAYERFDAFPIVSREIDQRYTSYVLVGADDPAVSLLDLRTKSFLFGPVDSTSGHVMPRYFLQNAGVAPEQALSKIDYSNSHADTIIRLIENEFDAGAVSAEVVDRMFQAGQLNTDELRVLWETPPYFNYTWVVQPDYSVTVINQIRDAFLSLTKSNSRHAQILETIGAEYYVPASVEDYDAFEEILNSIIISE